MAPQITTGDLLTMQDALTRTLRHELGLARQEFRSAAEDTRERLEEIKATQQEHHQRVLEVERAVPELRGAIARLDARTKLTARGILSSLSPKQKAALWSLGIAAGGALADGLRHLVSFLLAAFTRGMVQP